MNQTLKTVTSICFGCALLMACTAPITQIPGAENDQTLAGNDPQVTNSYADIPIAHEDVLVVSDSLLLNTGEQWTGRAVFRSKLDTTEAFKYFHQHMPTYGWIGITSVQSEVSVLTFEKGNRIATIQISKRTVSGSDIKVTVAPREATTK